MTGSPDRLPQAASPIIKPPVMWGRTATVWREWPMIKAALGLQPDSGRRLSTPGIFLPTFGHLKPSTSTKACPLRQRIHRLKSRINALGPMRLIHQQMS